MIRFFSKIQYSYLMVFIIVISNVYCNWENDKPNIILFLADDLGYTDLGITGSDFYSTPNIDKLARQSMHFINAYANAPNCAPTRASLMTGLYTPRHKIYTVNSSSRGKSQNRKIIPEPNETALDHSFVTIAYCHFYV